MRVGEQGQRSHSADKSDAQSVIKDRPADRVIDVGVKGVNGQTNTPNDR